MKSVRRSTKTVFDGQVEEVLIMITLSSSSSSAVIVSTVLHSFLCSPFIATTSHTCGVCEVFASVLYTCIAVYPARPRAEPYADQIVSVIFDVRLPLMS